MNGTLSLPKFDMITHTGHHLVLPDPTRLPANPPMVKIAVTKEKAKLNIGMHVVSFGNVADTHDFGHPELIFGSK